MPNVLIAACVSQGVALGWGRQLAFQAAPIKSDRTPTNSNRIIAPNLYSLYHTTMSFNIPQTDKKRVVIVGGGFGGLKLANKL